MVVEVVRRDGEREWELQGGRQIGAVDVDLFSRMRSGSLKKKRMRSSTCLEATLRSVVVAGRPEGRGMKRKKKNWALVRQRPKTMLAAGSGNALEGEQDDKSGQPEIFQARKRRSWGQTAG